jgi:hypothetical protein
VPTDAAHPAVALGLSYDELPQGSNLRREYDDAGGVTISAPAGDPSPAVLRAAMREGVGSAAALCGICLVIGGLVLVPIFRSNRIDPVLRVPAMVALGVLCTGVFLLAWRANYAGRAHALSLGRRQATVLHANAARVLIETSGPTINESHDVPVERITSWLVSPGPTGNDSSHGPLPCLTLLLSDGSSLQLLHGHHESEIRWAAGALSDVTGKPIEIAQGEIVLRSFLS